MHEVASKLAGLAVVALAAIGCSHTHRFNQDPPITAMQAHPLAGQVLAIDVSGVPESYRGSAQGHSFNVLGIRSHSMEVVRRAFANETLVADPAQAHAVIRLALQLELSGAFGGTSCNATATCEITRSGRTVVEEVTRTSSIPVMANGGRNCEIATLQAMSEALDLAMSKL